MNGVFTLDILAPDRHIYKGSALKATMPGAKAPFVILYNHAPIISLLRQGCLSWTDENGNHSIEISGGFVEVDNNVVTACVELT